MGLGFFLLVWKCARGFHWVVGKGPGLGVHFIENQQRARYLAVEDLANGK